MSRLGTGTMNPGAPASCRPTFAGRDAGAPSSLLSTFRIPLSAFRLSCVGTLTRSPGLSQHVVQVIAIFAGRHPLNEALKLFNGKKPAAKSRFFGTANLDALPFFDGLHISRSIMQAAARPRIEPGEAPAQADHPKPSTSEVFQVDVRDFQLAARRRFQP